MNCTRAGAGWFCRLEQEHDGPCPAWPNWWTRMKARMIGDHFVASMKPGRHDA